MPDVPARHRVQLGQVGARARELVQDGRGAGQEQLARGGERDTAGGALEQRCAQFRLQPPDLGRHRGLRDAQLLGGAAEPAVPRDRVEVDELPQLHGINNDLL